MVYHFQQAAGFFENSKLTIGTGSFFQQGVNMIYGMPAAKLIQHVVNKFQQFGDEYPRAHFLLLSKINELPVYSIPACAPFVFVDQCAAVLNEVEVL